MAITEIITLDTPCSINELLAFAEKAKTMTDSDLDAKCIDTGDYGRKEGIYASWGEQAERSKAKTKGLF